MAFTKITGTCQALAKVTAPPGAHSVMCGEPALFYKNVGIFGTFLCQEHYDYAVEVGD